jgi:hypothetical protein
MSKISRALSLGLEPNQLRYILTDQFAEGDLADTNEGPYCFFKHKTGPEEAGVIACREAHTSYYPPVVRQMHPGRWVSMEKLHREQEEKERAEAKDLEENGRFGIKGLFREALKHPQLMGLFLAEAPLVCRPWRSVATMPDLDLWDRELVIRALGSQERGALLAGTVSRQCVYPWDKPDWKPGARAKDAARLKKMGIKKRKAAETDVPIVAYEVAEGYQARVSLYSPNEQEVLPGVGSKGVGSKGDLAIRTSKALCVESFKCATRAEAMAWVDAKLGDHGVLLMTEEEEKV